MLDWSGYNERLVKRGEILLDLEFLKDMGREIEDMNEGKRGRPYTYGDSLFTLLGYFYAFIRNYRIIEGLCRGFRKLVRGFPTPDHSTIHRRLRGVWVNSRVKGKMLIVDSTGFRLGRATEYVEYRHKLRRRKKWLKLHIITDGEKIVRLEITAGSAGDSPAFRRMFKTLSKELKGVNVVIADSAYDSRINFDLIAQHGIVPLIKVRKNSTALSRGSPARRKAVLAQRCEKWARKSGYTKRWLVESLFSSLKRLFGETLSARKFHYALRELLIITSLFNLFRSL